MSCQPEQVTGFVDGALATEELAAVEAHLVECDACRTQAQTERTLRSRLLGLLHPPLPDQLEGRMRTRLNVRPGVPLRRLLVPLAAAAVLALVWARRSAPLMAWEMARDHAHCFAKSQLPAEVRAEDSETVMRWFEGRGSRMPVLPETAGGYHLTGARYCSFPDLTRAAHVYYRSDKYMLSVFVVARGIAAETPGRFATRGHVVQMARFGDMTIGVVGENVTDVDAVARTFRTSRASLFARAGPPLE